MHAASYVYMGFGVLTGGAHRLLYCKLALGASRRCVLHPETCVRTLSCIWIMRTMLCTCLIPSLMHTRSRSALDVIDMISIVITRRVQALGNNSPFLQHELVQRFIIFVVFGEDSPAQCSVLAISTYSVADFHVFGRAVDTSGGALPVHFAHRCTHLYCTQLPSPWQLVLPVLLHSPW